MFQIHKLWFNLYYAYTKGALDYFLFKKMFPSIIFTKNGSMIDWQNDEMILQKKWRNYL